MHLRISGATKEVREPLGQPDRMTHSGQQRQRRQRKHLLLRVSPGSRRSRSLGVLACLCRKGLGDRLWDYALPVWSLRPLPAVTLYRHRVPFPPYSRPASSLVCNSGDVGQDVLISHGFFLPACPLRRFAFILSSCANVAVVMSPVFGHLVLCHLAASRTGHSSTSLRPFACTLLVT